MLVRAAISVMLAAGVVLWSTARADEVADAKGVLAKSGIRLLSSGMILASEAELTKELGRATLLRRNLITTEKELQNAQQQAARAQVLLAQLKQQHVQLSAQLANINRNDVTLNNKLVGALNALEGQYELGQQQRERLDEQVRMARAKAGEAREAYIQFVLDARKLADRIEADYDKRKSDPELKTAFAALSQSGGKQIALAPSTGFQANLRRLKQLEDTVLSEAIDLRDDGGKTFRVNVVVNGQHLEEMVLDSGASLISLPYSLAAKFGLKPSARERKIILQLADGREIEGRLMNLASVRVGRFTVENVECAVLGEDAVAAEPLLGMSFLEHFKFEVDSIGKKLNMVKVGGNDSSTAKAGK